VIESASVQVNSEWVRQVQRCGLNFHTIIKSGVTVTEDDGNVTLTGRWTDVNSAINDIKDVIAERLCGAFDSLSHVNGSASRAVDRRSGKPDEVGAELDLMADQRRSASVTMNAGRDQVTAADRDQSLENIHPVKASASSEVCERQIEIDEHIWHYIKFNYPDVYKHWEQTLSLRLNTSAEVIEIMGQMQDVINFSEWCKRHDLISVTRRVMEVHSDIDVNRLKILADSSQAARFGVCVRFLDSTNMELIGKAGDIDNLISWLRESLHDFKGHRMTEPESNAEYSARMNGSNSADNGTFRVNSPVAGARHVMCKRPVILYTDQERLKFRTAEGQVDVEVLNGDLTRQKSEAIVNPANSYLLHAGGAARAIQNAAGYTLISECKDYIRKHRQLPTSEVMHTTAGKLPRPINYVIHACGPNARDCPDDKRCRNLLEKTFMNCFVYANDTLHVRSLSLPAISSGTIV